MFTLSQIHNKLQAASSRFWQFLKPGVILLLFAFLRGGMAMRLPFRLYFSPLFRGRSSLSLTGMKT